MIRKIKNTIDKHNLIEQNDKIIVALSGGADSVCLLHSIYCLKDEYNIQICAAHINHNLRGDDAKKDENFVVDICKKLNIECFVLDAKVVEYSKEKGISEEMAGREIRYAFFKKLISKYGYNKIATAHNKNDVAETILMNFMRGTSLSGLCGIPYVRGNIIRPVLDLTREEIEKYCTNNNLSFVTDKTNFQEIYTRNKIRLKLIPYIKNEFNQNFVNTLTDNAKIIKCENEFIIECVNNSYSKSVKTSYDGLYIKIHELNDFHEAIGRRVVLKMMQTVAQTTKNMSYRYVEDVLSVAKHNVTGKRVSLAYGIIARIEYGNLYIEKNVDIPHDFEYKIPQGISVQIKEANICVKIEKVDKIENNGKEYFFFDNDCDFIVRNRRNGDYFYPVGMSGKKKIKDYFIDTKIPSNKRDMIPILTCNDEIAWIIGKRRDRRFLNGKNVYTIQISAIIN